MFAKRHTSNEVFSNGLILETRLLLWHFIVAVLVVAVSFS